MIPDDHAVDHLPLSVLDGGHLDILQVARGDPELRQPLRIWLTTFPAWITYLLGRHAMLGQDPVTYRCSTTTARFPCEASDQAKNLPLPPPSTTSSYS